MNNYCCVGRLTKDLELANKGEYNIGRFTVAIPRTYKNEEGKYDSDFINCVLFNVSDYLQQTLKKGSMVSIQGRIQTRPYDDKDGNKRIATEVFVIHANVLKTPEKKEPLPNVKTEVQQQFEYTDEDLPF